MKQSKRKIYIAFLTIVGVLIVWFFFCLPEPLFDDPYSTVLDDSNGRLMAAKIATDGQWRFPESDSIPEKFTKAIIYFEDEYFFQHPGINPVSVFKAIGQNIRAGKVVRGGSTISQQVIRLSRKGTKRSVGEKLIEMVLALRLELKFSKTEILNLYTSHAPFGGNVVGLEAASWRYFSRSPEQLSWGEIAALAVLPNSPSLIYPGKNQEILLIKRNRLLDKLSQKGIIDFESCELAKSEPLPGTPQPLPQLTPHLLDRFIKEGHSGIKQRTTINRNIQRKTEQIVNKHHNHLRQNEIYNAAAIVLEVKTGNVLAYVGNTNCDLEDSGKEVDIIQARRSSGSILKPFLYALMQKEGMLLPQTLIADVPTRISGFNPKNYDKTYDGAVHADNALARSLNVPAVKMLQEYGIDRFLNKLQKLQFSTFNKNADHYGLSLILGGAETTLWDLGSVYAMLARNLNNFEKNGAKYNVADQHMASFFTEVQQSKKLIDNIPIGAGASWLTFEALSEMNRPLEGTNWQVFQSSQKIAWKTGTSFGHRDAWTVGITPNYVIAVWVGNADGEGRPALTGANSAAPILFDIFKILPESGWFEPPYNDLIEIMVCPESGMKAGIHCPNALPKLVNPAGENTQPCPYHQLVHLDKTEKFRVNGNCYPVSDMLTKPWFVLPTVMEWYYKSKDPYYKTLPSFHPNCFSEEEKNMDLIYPKSGTKIFIARGFEQTEKTLFTAAHRLPNTTIHWHLDEIYLGSTSDIHQMEIFSNEGQHTIMLVDENGEILNRSFELIGK